MTPNADGPDISRWNPVADWDAIPQFRLFVTKATGTSRIEITEHVDPTFHDNWQQMRRRNFEFRGAYHWLRPDIPIVDQVELLHATLDSHGGLQVGEFVMLDWERSPGLPIPSVAQVDEWLTLAAKYWPGRLALYGAEWVTGFAEWRTAHPDFPLFYAAYNLTTAPAKLAQWGADVWQWSSTQPVPGIADETCDMNAVLNWSTLDKITAKQVTMYPDGYGVKMTTLAAMRAKHEPKMHPEFARRFFAYIEAHNGTLGVGGGWRSTSTISAASAAGKSFHQDQRFASGFVGYAAVDLVHIQPGQKHRAPTWDETADAPTWGLHTFIKVPNEPWHIQCVEMRGFQTWVDAGRPDPKPFALPGTDVPPPTTGKQTVDMILVDLNPGTDWWVSMLLVGTELSHNTNGHTVAVLKRGSVPSVTTNETELLGMLRDVSTTNASPFAPGMPAFNQALHDAWVAAA